MHFDVRLDVQRHLDVHVRRQAVHPAHPAREGLPQPVRAVRFFQTVPDGFLTRVFEDDEVGGGDIRAVAQGHVKMRVVGGRRDDVHVDAVFIALDRGVARREDRSVEKVVLLFGRLQDERVLRPHVYVVGQIAQVPEVEFHVESGAVSPGIGQFGRLQGHHVVGYVDRAAGQGVGNVRIIDRRFETFDADGAVQNGLEVSAAQRQPGAGLSLRFAQHAFQHRSEQCHVDFPDVHFRAVTAFGRGVETGHDVVAQFAVGQPETGPFRLKIPEAVELRVSPRDLVDADAVEIDVCVQHSFAVCSDQVCRAVGVSFEQVAPARSDLRQRLQVEVLQAQPKGVLVTAGGRAVDREALRAVFEPEVVYADPRGVVDDLPGADSPGLVAGRERGRIKVDFDLRNARSRIDRQRGSGAEHRVGAVCGVVEPHGQVDPVLFGPADDRKVGHVQVFGQQVVRRYEHRDRVALVTGGRLQVRDEELFVLDEFRVQRQREDVAFGVEQKGQRGSLGDLQARNEDARHVVGFFYIDVQQVVVVDAGSPVGRRNRFPLLPVVFRDGRKVGYQRVFEVRKHFVVAEPAFQFRIGERRIETQQFPVAVVVGQHTDPSGFDGVDVLLPPQKRLPCTRR